MIKTVHSETVGTHNAELRRLIQGVINDLGQWEESMIMHVHQCALEETADGYNLSQIAYKWYRVGIYAGLSRILLLSELPDAKPLGSIQPGVQERLDFIKSLRQPQIDALKKRNQT